MKEHGEVEISWEGNLLVVNAHGAFNKEGIETAHASIMSELKSLGHQQWKRLDILSDMTLPTEDAIPGVKTMYLESARAGCTHAAIISPFGNMMKSLFESDEYRIHYFADEASARQWLSE